MTPARRDWVVHRWLPHWLDTAEPWLGHLTDLVTRSPGALARAHWQAVDSHYIFGLQREPERWRALRATIPGLPDGNLPDDVMQALQVAYVATRGRDLAPLIATCPRPAARPPKRGLERTRTRSIVLPVDLDDQVDAVAAELGVTSAEVYRRAVRAGLPIVSAGPSKDDADHNLRVMTSVLR